MKTYSLILIFLFSGWTGTLFAQTDYSSALQQGQTALQRGDYETALKKFRAAQAFDPSKRTEVDKEIDKVFEGMRQQRDQAVADKRRAQDAEKKAKEQTALAEAETQKAEEERDRANRLLRYTQKMMLIAEESEIDKANALKFQLEWFEQIIAPLDSAAKAIFKSKLREIEIIKAGLWTNSFLEHGKAIQLANSILQQDSLHFEARRIRLIARMRDDQIAAALADADFLLRHQAFETTASLNKPLLLSYSGRLQEARLLIDTFLHIAPIQMYGNVQINSIPEDITRATGVVSLRLRAKEYQQVLQLYDNAIACLENPESGFANFLRLPIEDCDLNVALYVVNKIQAHLRNRPQDYILEAPLAIIWRHLGFPEQAARAQERLTVAQQNGSNLAFNRIVLPLEQETLTPEGGKMFLPEMIEALRSKRFMAAGRDTAAYDAIKKAMALSPHDPEIQAMTAYCAHRIGRFEESIQLYDSLIANIPNCRLYYSDRGWVKSMLNQGDFSEGASDIEQALHFNPYNFDALLYLLFQGFKEHDLEKAYKAYRRMVTSGQEHIWLPGWVAQGCLDNKIEVSDFVTGNLTGEK